MPHDHTADNNPSANPSFESIVSTRLSRRDLLGGATALAITGGTFVGTANAHGGFDDGYGGYGQRNLKLAFNPVAKSLDDAVALPAGYSYDVLYALGDPISRHVNDFANDGSDDPASFAFRAGDHHDGMHFFGMGAGARYSRD